jgi:hypothetical protein
MKRIFCVGALAVVLAATVTTTALASGLSGTWRTTVSRPWYLAGTYHITFRPGHWLVSGPISSRGTDRVSGSKITIRGTGPCAASGTYRFALGRGTVKFTRISDPCPRSSLITAHAWRRS